jgi:pilus assembly protein Flp/PilA
LRSAGKIVRISDKLILSPPRYSSAVCTTPTRGTPQWENTARREDGRLNKTKELTMLKVMVRSLIAVWKKEAGLTTVEYAIAGGLVAAGVIGAFQLLGKGVYGVINYLQGALNGITLP